MSSDILDQASELEELMRSAAIFNAINSPLKPSRSHCVDCDDAIPERRQILVKSCQRCVNCQTMADIKAKHWSVER